ncbi:MAG TPA: hypothetical protein VD931_23525 [Baekduia sp.]|nr:hypothetical protein [Baekduia sp.]
MRVIRRAVVVLCCACAALVVVPAAGAQAPGTGDPMEALTTRGDRYQPKPPGTVEDLKFWFGPYVVPPGWDANRFDLDLPLANGHILSIEPGMRRVQDLSEPTHQEAHIHHAHWFAVDPGNEEDNYTGGNTEWIFGNGDEETKADFTERTAADPKGPVYGQFVGASGPQLMIYMLHNKTSQPLLTYIVLDVKFLHGTAKEAAAALERPVHDVSGVLFGRTYSVPRQKDGDGRYSSTQDTPKPIEWTSTVDGTIIGTGSHLHPGGLRVQVENLGSKAQPCPDDGQATGGTLLLNSDALFRNALYSEDFQMEVTHPAWRAPVRKGDRIRITGVYENKDHAWYDVMTHQGLYIDEQQPPQGRCRPYFVGGVQEQRTRVKRRKHVHWRKLRAKRGARAGKVVRQRVVHWHRQRVTTGVPLTEGVPNRPFGHHPDLFCGEEFGALPCDRPITPRPPGRATETVSIANFLYMPGDQSLSGEDGAPPRVKRGRSLTFVNVDQAANIRHTVTTCAWPCNGRYVANYPLPDGVWDSTTLGYDLIDGGNPNPVAKTPPDLSPGKYAYFCRIHPWMRGAFEVVE